MHIHQQQQIMAQQQMQAAAVAAAQQQQTFQMQQQYPTNSSFFNQPPFFPINSVNMSPFPNPTAPPIMYNNPPSWNFMSTPPPFYTPPQNPVTNPAQPPLPPPELKAEKPPLPKDPEPALGLSKRNDFLTRLSRTSPNYNSPRQRTPGTAGGIRIRGVNALNGAVYNGFNGGPGGIRGPPAIRQPNLTTPPPNYPRHRRRNPHHFPGMNQHPFYPRIDLTNYGGEYGDLSQFNEEDQPAGSDKLTIILNDVENSTVQVNKKAKRKPMSTRYTRSREWQHEDAEAALALEKEFSQASRRQMLILKFPDPDVNKYIVKKYSPAIETVHFQQPSTPRYCFVQLKEGTDVDKVLETIREIPFGTGKIAAELKTQPSEENAVSPKEIDPYTLYVGNLPTTITVTAVKKHFPNAQRIDIGYAQRMRYTRYAFVRYSNFEEAKKAYKNAVNKLFESRSLIVRFRRQKGNIGLPGETKSNTPVRGDEPETASIEKIKPWDDADVDDVYHEDENGFILDDIEEDDDDGIDHDDEVESATNPMTNEQSPGKAAALAKAQNEPRNADKDSQPGASSVSANGAETILEDSKDDVLQRANKMLKEAAVKQTLSATATALTARPKSESPDCICTDPPEAARKVHLEPTVKREHNADDSSSDNDGINLLGTRVKDEYPTNADGPPTPTMDDIYLDDYEYDDMDEEPEEEDDDWADASLSTRQTNWEEIRRRELNAAREEKPDLDKLGIINDSLSTATSVLPIVANLEPKTEFDKLYSTSEGHKDGVGETDELHDIFSDVNSDFDDDDTQF